MKYKIRKLNELQHTDSFMQINYLRGFKYVDRAGEIINLFFGDKEEPPYTMTTRDLIIKKDRDESQTYRIAVDNTWIHDASPQNLGSLLETFNKRSSAILKILEVEEVVRVGWRNYFVEELQNADDKRKILNRFLPVQAAEFSEVRFKKKILNFNCNVNLRGAEKNDASRTPALIFDIDCYKECDTPVGVAEASDELKKIKAVLLSSEMLDLFNSILTQNSNP